MIYKIKKKSDSDEQTKQVQRVSSLVSNFGNVFFSFFFLLHLKVSTEQLSSQKSVKESGHLHTQHCSHIWILYDVHMYLHMFMYPIVFVSVSNIDESCDNKVKMKGAEIKHKRKVALGLSITLLSCS